MDFIVVVVVVIVFVLVVDHLPGVTSEPKRQYLVDVMPGKNSQECTRTRCADWMVNQEGGHSHRRSSISVSKLRKDTAD